MCCTFSASTAAAKPAGAPGWNDAGSSRRGKANSLKLASLSAVARKDEDASFATAFVRCRVSAWATCCSTSAARRARTVCTQQRFAAHSGGKGGGKPPAAAACATRPWKARVASKAACAPVAFPSGAYKAGSCLSRRAHVCAHVTLATSRDCSNACRAVCASFDSGAAALRQARKRAPWRCMSSARSRAGCMQRTPGAAYSRARTKRASLRRWPTTRRADRRGCAASGAE